MSSVRNGKRCSSLSSHSITGRLFACAFSSLLDGSFHAIRKCVHCVRFSSTTPPCFIRISANVFLGISNVPVMQNDTPVSLPSITFFLRSKIEKFTHSSLSNSSICLLSSFENRVLREMIVSSPIHFIDKRNSSFVRRRSMSSIEKFFFSAYQLAVIASTMICAVFLPICWIPKPFITRRNALFFDFFNSSVIS